MRFHRVAANVGHIRRQGFEIPKLVYFRKFNQRTKAESLHFCPAFVYALLAVVLLLNKFKNSLIMNKNILKEIAIMLFELQYEKNGLYGYDISFRMVTDNKSFRVIVFHHGNRDFYMDVKTIDDINKLNDKIWN